MDIRQLLPHLYFFWVVAKYKNYAKAADSLRISVSALVYHIKSIEKELQAVIINKKPNNEVAFTPAGEHLAGLCHKIFQYMDNTIGEEIREEKDSDLNITTFITFGNCVLVPSTTYMNTHLPGVGLRFQLANQLNRLVGDDMDIIISDKNPGSYFTGKELMYVRHMVITSYQYLSKAPVLQSLADIKNHKLIIAQNYIEDWKRVEKKYSELIIPSEDNIVYASNNYGILNAVKAGMGLALVPSYLLHDMDLKTKGMLTIFDDIFTNDDTALMDTIYVYYPKLSVKYQTIEMFISNFKNYLMIKGYKVID